MQINKRQTRQTDTIGKLLEGNLADPQGKRGPVIASHCKGHVSPGKLKNSWPAAISHTVLDGVVNMGDESKIPIRNRKRIL